MIVTDKRKPFVVGPYYANPSEKQAFLRGIFDRTAPHYERIAQWGWFGTGETYRRQALLRAGVTADMKVIDVASGTGPVARAFMKILNSPDQIVCVEPSAGMIAESKKTVPAVHHQGTAEALPVGDEAFDFLTMGFAVRHVDDLDAAFREFRRVLRDGGKLLIMDVTKPDSAMGRFWFRLYFKHLLPFLSLVSTGDRESHRLMKYYWDTMDQMIAPDDLTRLLTEAGFRNAERHVVLGCFSEYRAER
tara:strand:+ start:1981 stop:2721 length:741 start_codon:yes stop_codon:yes gene_type:complete